MIHPAKIRRRVATSTEATWFSRCSLEYLPELHLDVGNVSVPPPDFCIFQQIGRRRFPFVGHITIFKLPIRGRGSHTTRERFPIGFRTVEILDTTRSKDVHFQISFSSLIQAHSPTAGSL